MVIFFVSFSTLFFSTRILDTKAVGDGFCGYLTDRFDDEGVENVSVDLYYEDGIHSPYYAGSDETDENGWWQINVGPPSGWWLWAAFIQIEKSGYITEYYELGNSGQFDERVDYTITPIYECTLYGYVKQDWSPYSGISGATVQLWGVDYHTHHFLCASRTTSSTGYYIFDDLTFNFADPEVAIYYYIKVSKLGYVTETENISPYPYPNASMNLGTTYLWGFFRF